MKNYSDITENLDITTKQYVDQGLTSKADVNDIPTSTTVSGWGFTKNTGTVTSVAVKMNGESKGTVTSSGTIDLGTVITSHQDISGLMPKSGGTFTGEVKFGNTENFQGYYIKRMIGSLGAGTAYTNLDSSYKDGTWHRMWRLRFPSGSNFWGKIKVTLYGGYSSFNASGVMSKSITCNFNTSSIYNNVGCYDGLGVNVEQDFRISEAIWNATASAWEVLIWQKNLSGNNSPAIMLECWTTNNTNYINAFNGIAAQAVELTQSTSYSAQKASSTGGTKTVTWATLPVYENPLGEELALTSQVNAKYTKPSGGIPKTDLASDVQTSLGKADSALSIDGGTINKSKTIKMDASANSNGANLKWGTVNSKNPYIGYASDQSDGTFVVSSLLGTNYASGLAIGGGSGNLLWKGTKVATISDIPDISGKANLDELTAHINTVATQTTLGHIKMYVEGDTLYLNT